MNITLSKAEADVLGLKGRTVKLDVPMQKNKSSQGITPLPHADLPIKVCGTVLTRQKSDKRYARAL